MRYQIVSTRDGHVIDTARTPQEAENKSWWRTDAAVVEVSA